MTSQPTGAVNPSPASVAALASTTDNTPIGMLNLLRYAKGDGAAAYRRYTDVAGGAVARVGGGLIFMGAVSESDEPWDTAILVYYPRRAAFVAMQNDPAYIGAIPDRTEGLAARLLYPFALPEITAAEAAEQCVVDTGASLTVQLRRFGDDADAAPSTVDIAMLRLPSGGPGMVSDGRWDELVVARAFDSMPALPGSAVATMTMVVTP